jgi:hypothetical protein
MIDGRRFRKKDNLVVRRVADEAFLVPICGRPQEMRNVFVLNELAEFIWQRLEGEPTLDEILAAVLDSFEIDRDQARKDASEFIGRLLENNLIQERP